MDNAPITNMKNGEHAFLSNFHPSPITHEGIEYPTAEHAFQAAKTLDQAQRQRIANLATPGKAKYAGKRVALRTGWNEIRAEVMAELIAIKFQAGTELAAQLDATGDRELIEGNTWGDKTWGMTRKNGEWSGQNLLGKILMAQRTANRK